MKKISNDHSSSVTDQSVKGINKKEQQYFQLCKTCMLLTILGFLITSVSNAQSPEVQWRNYYFPGYQKNNNLLINLPPGFDPTHEEYSSEDWIYDVKPVYEGGVQTGYICAGYTSFMNNGDNTNGCPDAATAP